jgi:hypothetical protein
VGGEIPADTGVRPRGGAVEPNGPARVWPASSPTPQLDSPSSPPIDGLTAIEPAGAADGEGDLPATCA